MAARTPPGPLAIVALSIAAVATGTFVSVSLGVLAPELRDAFGFSRSEIGLLASLYAIGGAASSPVAGGLTDRLGPARVLALSLAVIAGATVLGALAPVGAVLMAAALLAGVGYGGVNPPTNVIVAGRLGERLGFFLSLKQTGVPLGGFVAGLLLPALADAAGWRWAFSAGAMGTAVAALLALRLRGAGVLRGGSAEGAEEAPGGPVASVVPSRRRLAGVVGYGFLLAGCQWVVTVYLVLSLHDGRGWSLAEAGLALSTFTAVSAGARLAWGWLSDRATHRERTLALQAVVAAGALAVLAVEPPRPVVFVVAGVLGGSLAAWNGVYHALVVDRSGARTAGRDSGRMLAFLFAGTVVVPPLLGLVSQLTGSWTVLWAVNAVLVLVGAAALGLAAPGRRAGAPSR